jgi:hypothetical protein
MFPTHHQVPLNSRLVSLRDHKINYLINSNFFHLLSILLKLSKLYVIFKNVFKNIVYKLNVKNILLPGILEILLTVCAFQLNSTELRLITKFMFKK